jgi:hypothetical protein
VNIYVPIRLNFKKNPFKNYKQALKFLRKEYNKKLYLTNAELTDTDFAIERIIKHEAK